MAVCSLSLAHQPELREGLIGRNLGRLDTPSSEGRRLRRLAPPPGASAMLFRYSPSRKRSGGVIVRKYCALGKGRTGSEFRASGYTVRMTVRRWLARGTVSAWVVGMLATGCGSDASEMSTDLPEWSLSPVVLVQPEQVPFGRVADLEVGDDGSVFVLDALSRTIRVFDQAGSEVREFGGRGQGPGGSSTFHVGRAKSRSLARR